jgi:hypothetical protein
MDDNVVVEGWNGLRPPCGLTGKPIQDGDYVVWFPYFITDKEDPFWKYNEWPMLREAFDEWEHKEAFLARWHESLLTNVVPRVRVLVDRADYLVWLGGSPRTIVLNFLAHGFGLSVSRDSWRAFEDLLLGAPQRPGRFRLPNNSQISVGTDGNMIRIAWEPSPTFKEGKRDRILLDQLEWRVLKEVLCEIDRLLVHE